MPDDEIPRENILFREMEQSAQQTKKSIQELRLSIGRKYILVRKAQIKL